MTSFRVRLTISNHAPVLTPYWLHSVRPHRVTADPAAAQVWAKRETAQKYADRFSGEVNGTVYAAYVVEEVPGGPNHPAPHPGGCTNERWADVNVKLALISDSGEIIDSTEEVSAQEWNRARESMPGALALLRELKKVDEP